MQFLRADRSPPTRPWWQHVADNPNAAPVIVREMLRDNSVVCDRAELVAAIEWASRQHAWTDSPAPLWEERV